LRRRRKFFRKIDAGEVQEITVYKNKIASSDPLFKMHLQNFRRSCTSTIEQLKGDIDLYGKILNAWKPRPMPKDGEHIRVLKFFLK
jgi:hypothetical protein